MIKIINKIILKPVYKVKINFMDYHKYIHFLCFYVYWHNKSIYKIENDTDKKIKKAWAEFIKELNMWEYFCDRSYYDMWAVRNNSDKSFTSAVHVMTENEAKFLVEKLNKLQELENK